MQDITPDGRYVVFTSFASNLVASDTNARTDVFVRDRSTFITTRVSISTGNAEGNDPSGKGNISSDGSIIAFESTASNLVAADMNGVKDVFVRNINLATTIRASVTDSEAELGLESQNPTISADGNLIAFQTETSIAIGDNNFSSDVYLRNVTAGTTLRVSVGPGGQEASGFSNFPDISADGTLVVFSSRSITFGLATEKTRIYLKNLTTGAIEHVSLSASDNDGSGNSDGPRISADGRYVGFSSDAPDLVSGDSNIVNDLFVRDRTLGTTARVSVTSTGAHSTAPPFSYFAVPFYTANDGTVAFGSSATDLVPGDTLGFGDVFTGSAGSGAAPVVDNSALIAKYEAQIKKLTKQIKAAKKKGASDKAKKLGKALKKVQAVIAAL